MPRQPAFDNEDLAFISAVLKALRDYLESQNGRRGAMRRLAIDLGVSPGMVNKLKRHDFVPNAVILARACAVLGLEFQFRGQWLRASPPAPAPSPSEPRQLELPLVFTLESETNDVEVEKIGPQRVRVSIRMPKVPA